MLPLLLRLDLGSDARRALFVLAALAVTAWAAYQGHRREGPAAAARWQAGAYGCTAALAAVVAFAWLTPPLGGLAAGFVRALLIALAGGLTLSAVQLSLREGPPEEARERALTWGVAAAVVGAVAVRVGWAGLPGRGVVLALPSYGVLILTGCLVGSWVAGRRAEKIFTGTVEVEGRQVPAGPVMRGHVRDLGLWLLVLGLVGSRLFHVALNWGEYRRDWTQILALDRGLVFLGGILTAMAVGAGYTWHHRLPFWRFADLAALGVAVGHLFGRLGCFCAGCCWGAFAPHGSGLAVRFPSARFLSPGSPDSVAYLEQLHDPRFVDGLGQVHAQAVEGATRIGTAVAASGYSLPVYPIQLVEAAGELGLFLFLLWVARRQRFDGQLAGLWLVGYAVLRGGLEALRGDVSRGFLLRYPADLPVVLSTSQAIAVGMLALGVGVLLLRGRDRALHLHSEAAGSPGPPGGGRR